MTRGQNRWTQNDLFYAIQTLTQISQKLHYRPKWYCVGFQTLSVWPKNYFYVIVWFLWIFESWPYNFLSCLTEQWKTQCDVLLEDGVWGIQFFIRIIPDYFSMILWFLWSFEVRSCIFLRCFTKCFFIICKCMNSDYYVIFYCLCGDPCIHL